MWIWQHLRHAAHPGPLGFVDVDNAVAGVLAAAGAATEVYDMYAMIDDSPLGPPITGIVLTPSSVQVDKPLGTVVGTLSATGGMPPLHARLLSDDSGNFSLGAGSLQIKTARSPLTSGAHVIRVAMYDDGGHVTAADLAINAFVAAEPPDAATTKRRQKK
jgi:hypothetical protein